MLTVFSILLSGVVISYVTNVDNFKSKYDEAKAQRDASREKSENLTKKMDDLKEEVKQKEDSLNKQLTSLKSQVSELQNKLNAAERENSTLLTKVNNWTSVVQDFQKTNDQQAKLLGETQADLKRIQEKQIDLSKKYEEASYNLIEKMSIIDTLQKEKMRLIEEKNELQERIDQYLRPQGKVTAPTTPVTQPGGEVQMRQQAMPAPSQAIPAKEIALKGLVTNVDLKNSIASISLGKADGVREGMRFHVTRGDEFICDILIIDVDAEEAVGVLELVQENPRIGDSVMTNF